MSSRPARDAIMVFLVAFAARSVAVAVTTATSLNTYAQADAERFARSANRIASAVASGTIPEFHPGNILHLWGAMLSPFWFLPGPSRVYARVGMALLGAVAVYNVYVIARYYHSRRAGILAILPFLCYPSILFLHATVLREALVLFGLTSVARLLLVPSPRLRPVPKYAAVALLLYITTLVRDENLPVYLLVLAVAAIVAARPWQRAPRTTRIVALSGSIVGLPGAIVVGRRVLEELAPIRRWRARGRTEYLGWVIPETVPEAVVFSWIGAAYFLFSPFPWMVTLLMDYVVMIEAFVNLGYALAALVGLKILGRRTLPGTVALAVGTVVGSVLYGIGTANVGTAVRHRPMVLWAIFLLGGIGLAHYLRVQRCDEPA